MNIALLDPFGQDFPTGIVNRLIHDDATTTITCTYNRRGNLLASGTRDGKCIIWDLDTHHIALKFKAHVQPITSISFSRKGRHLLTASRDWSCSIWDLKTQRRKHRVAFGSPVLEAVLHPRNRRVVLVIAQGDPPYIVHFHKNENDFTKIQLSLHGIDKQIQQDKLFAVCVSFTPDGKHALVGSTKGAIHVFESSSGKALNVFDIQSNTSIRMIRFSKSGRELLINGADRMLRTFNVFWDENGLQCEPKNKFMDVINRIQWTQCCFSADEEYVVGTCESSQKHSLFVYIWDKDTGILVKMLEGPREGLADMAWHPFRPSFVTISHFGTIYIWGVHYTQNFSAFAPSFTELDDNVDYEEREDEFDVALNLKSTDVKDDEETRVDIITCDFKVVSDTEDEGDDFEIHDSSDPFYLSIDFSNYETP